MGSAGPLWDRSILIVEDEPLIALDVHRALSAAGASVIAAMTSADALTLIFSAEVTAAIIDVSLGKDDCCAVCHALAARKIPFMFYTGYSPVSLAAGWPNVPALSKPAGMDDVISTLAQLIATPIASPTIPGVSRHDQQQRNRI